MIIVTEQGMQNLNEMHLILFFYHMTSLLPASILCKKLYGVFTPDLFATYIPCKILLRLISRDDKWQHGGKSGNELPSSINAFSKQGPHNFFFLLFIKIHNMKANFCFLNNRWKLFLKVFTCQHIAFSLV